jgi:hypothetical protein
MFILSNGLAGLAGVLAAGVSPGWVLAVIIPLLLLWLATSFVGARYIPNDAVGIVEKLWSLGGSVGEGRIIASRGEAGYQAGVLRGGMHFRLWRWQYRIRMVPLVTVPQGKIAYVYARDGEPLAASQTLARVVDCNNFQDAEVFLGNSRPGATAAAAGAELTMTQRRPFAVRCNTGVLTSLIANLTRNALKYIGDGPVRRVEVDVFERGERVRFEVRDTGPGLPPDVENRVFDAHARARNATQPGLGLGLATVKRLAEAHGGSVGVTSVLGRGCTFWFELPSARRTATADAPP